MSDDDDDDDNDDDDDDDDDMSCLILRYHSALSNTGLISLSTPYLDALGTGVVIAAAHTIYRGEINSHHTTSDKVIAVMGADFPLSYFQK